MTEIILAVTLILAVVLGLAGLTVAVLRAADVLGRIHGDLSAMEAEHAAARDAVHQGLGQLTDAVRHHTSALRDTAAQAPEAVIEQRNRLAADNEKLAAALEKIVTFRPDPQKGTYGAGAQDVLDYAKVATQEVLS